MVAVLADALHEDFELLWRQIGQLLPEPVQIEKDMGVMAQVVGDDPVELWGAFGQVARDDGVDLVAAWSRWAVAKLPGPRFRVYEEWLIRCAEAMRETPLDQVSAARMFDCLDEISVEAGERIDGYEAMLHFYAWLKEVRKGQRTTAADPADVVSTTLDMSRRLFLSASTMRSWGPWTSVTDTTPGMPAISSSRGKVAVASTRM